MYISDKAWNKYISLLRKVNEKAAEEMFSYLAHHNWWTSRAEKLAAIDYAYGLATKYGEAAGAAVCEFYDEIAEEWAGRTVAPAVPARTATYGEVAKTVNGTGKTLNTKMMSEAIGRLVKMAGVDTMMQNALRDGAEWAWIPAGDTCPFCLTLASRGWQEASAKAIRNGHAEHIHANCDCTYAVRFSPDQNVEGYDPEEYRELYYSAEGNTPEEKINSMRRIKYGMEKDKINAQKRIAYAARHSRDIETSASKLESKFGTYIPDEKTRQEIIKRGIEAERPIFADDLLGELAKGLPPKEGWYDVVLHGWPDHLEFFGQKIDVETLCAIIAQRKDYKKGVPIRLISCYTGKKEDGVAQYVANKLHVDVEAPDRKGVIFRSFSGRYEVYSGSEIGVRDGNMITKHPKETKVISDEKGASRVYY